MVFGYNFLLGGRAVVNHGQGTLFALAADASLGGSLGYEFIAMNAHLFSGPSWSQGETGLFWGAQLAVSVGLPIMPGALQAK